MTNLQTRSSAKGGLWHAQSCTQPSTQKKGRLQIDRESSKGENQGPDLFVRTFILRSLHPSKPTLSCNILDQVLMHITRVSICTRGCPHLISRLNERRKSKARRLSLSVSASVMPCSVSHLLENCTTLSLGYKFMAAVATSSHIHKPQSRCDASYLVPISARGILHLIFRLHVGLSPEQQGAKPRVPAV